jgi:2-C-methyl-D-erythritol 2,4-cyclodiphosphate synthase
LVEALGKPVTWIQGEETNVKLTTPQDWETAEQSLQTREGVGPMGEGSGGSDASPPPRIGYGYDIHQISPTRPLWLGGELFENHPGLEGHSDADVLLHAVCDAILGAAALGDIGQHFPNTDPSWKDAKSLDLLAHCANLAKDAGYQIANIDCTLISESPKVMPRAEAIKANIATACNLSPAQVNVKATTNEGLGAIGAKQGMAAQAVALLCRC